MAAAPYERQGAILREARKRLGKTQKQIGDEVDAKQPQISKWEAGEALPPSDKLRSVAVAYEISLDDYLPVTAQVEVDQAEAVKAS